MPCTISRYFTDDELVSKLRMYFKYTEMWNIDFYACLKTGVTQLEDNYCLIKVKKRKFKVDKITGAVFEVK